MITFKSYKNYGGSCMKRLFILGNGFDKAHLLSTDYTDYRKYIEENNPSLLNNIESAYGVWKDIKFWEDFEERLGEGDEFEAEFYNMGIQSIEEMITDEGDEMPDVEQTLRTHFEVYYRFMEELGESFCDWVRTIDLEEVIPTYRFDKTDLFFTFNYTKVLEEVYGIPNSRVVHIHGSVDDDCVVIGHGNKAKVEEYEEEENKCEEELEKNMAVIFGGISEFYRLSLKNPEENMIHVPFGEYAGVKEVHIMGHSLGDVDIPYFAEIKKAVESNAEWFLYIYDLSSSTFPTGKIKKLEGVGIDSSHIHIEDSKRFPVKRLKY